MPTRRRLLAAAGVAAASSGCMSVLGDEGDSESESGTSPDPEPAAAGSTSGPQTVRLGELSVQNNHDEAHRVQLAVGTAESLLHLGTYDLDASGSSTTVKGDWSEESASYRVHAKLDDGEIRTADVTQGITDDASCVRVLVRVDNKGNLGIWNGAGCE